MPLSEPIVTIAVPCGTCGGTGEREPEQFTGGFDIRAAGGGKLQCTACGGTGAQRANYTLPGFAELIAPHLPKP